MDKNPYPKLGLKSIIRLVVVAVLLLFLFVYVFYRNGAIGPDFKIVLIGPVIGIVFFIWFFISMQNRFHKQYEKNPELFKKYEADIKQEMERNKKIRIIWNYILVILTIVFIILLSKDLLSRK